MRGPYSSDVLLPAGVRVWWRCPDGSRYCGTVIQDGPGVSYRRVQDRVRVCVDGVSYVVPLRLIEVAA